MSSPISSFSKLSITQRMQSSRGHEGGHSGEGGKGRPTPEDGPSSSDESSDEEESEVEDEDEDSEDEHDFEEGATEGSLSKHTFALDHCRQHETRFAFQIADAEVTRCSVRIGSTGRPTCTCDEEGTCRHIVWLLSQLARTSTKAAGASRVEPHEQISTLGLGNVCEKLHWELREGPGDSEETQWKINKDYSSSLRGRQANGIIRERMKVVRDILATFSPLAMDDYRADIFESREDVAWDDLFVPRDLEATLCRLLVLNDDIFHKFQSIVSNNTRASDYFRKMALKARATCDLLDKYCDIGPVGTGFHTDLVWCAQTLADIVDSISANVFERQPLSSSSREEAAKALITILRMVVKERNHDVYQDLKWPRRRIHGEPQIDRNLYQRLIGSNSQANPAGGNFVIKALQDLPEAQRFVEELEHLLGILGSVGWGAPRPYQDKLRGLVAQLKSGSLPIASSSGKRAAGTMDRKVKRMK